MRRRYVFTVFVFIFALNVLILTGCGSDSPTDPDNGDPEGPAIWYVNADAMGTGDGKSWDNAFDHPADAMSAASSGDQIWVTGLTYFGPGDRNVPVVAFKAGVSLYGGFIGVEDDLSDRNMDFLATFDGGDTLYHVVTGADDALLHGILVTNGNATGTGSPDEARGGGVYCLESGMRISNCTILDNAAIYGGGIYAEGDTIEVDSCSIVDNDVITPEGYEMSGGGGICVVSGHAVIDRCTISNNTAQQKGAGLLLHNSMAVTSNTDFTINITGGANYNGGGVFISNEQTQSVMPEFISCGFFWNSSGYGGAVHLHYSSTYFTDCEFEDNSANMTGAAVYASNSSHVMEHCVFEGNDVTAVFSSSAMGSTVPRIFNCLFFENGRNGSHGGAIYNYEVDTEIECCTITGNTASNGGGIYSSGCSPVVTNCIIWGNTATAGEPQVHDVSGGTTIVTYTDIDQDGYDTGAGNIRSDPLFITGPRDGDYYLGHTAAGQAANSPCIDAGSNTSIFYFLHTMTTRTDNMVDAGQVDLGFHYETDD